MQRQTHIALDIQIATARFLKSRAVRDALSEIGACTLIAHFRYMYLNRSFLVHVPKSPIFGTCTYIAHFRYMYLNCPF